MAFKRILPVGVFLLLACFAAHNSFAADLKIGVINVQKIIVSCVSGKAAKERFDVKMKELQAKTEDARFEMKQLQDKELEPILKALEKVVEKYGKEKGYTAILDSKNGVVYFNETIEISDAIVQKLNEAMAAGK